MTVIAEMGGHTIFTVPDPDVEPGRQLICVMPVDSEAHRILSVLTGTPHESQRLHLLPGAQIALVARHDRAADRRLMQLVDVAAEIRLAAPQVMQLQLAGMDA